MPMYSAVSDAIQRPALNTASTSVLAIPASASAFRAASACSAKADLWGSLPISSDSATPTIATLAGGILVLRPGHARAGGGRGRECPLTAPAHPHPGPRQP